MNVQYEVNGLVSFRETRDASHMPVPHSHNEIEVLLIEKGGEPGSWAGKRSRSSRGGSSFFGRFARTNC